ncbi:bifunctional endo-1,4-beta-xylanase XylA-like [Anopheles albimanus]|uniref:Uncharacterized protein n=1 Tax=Anopheles albimanus TaxID=7167 RepID=A0A182FEE3_ANOAL|nr:bifunctional endo-1,4-beta-xylanase XylA-like [Anopheles albimanus]
MFKFVLIGALFVVAVCAAPADNKPGQQQGQQGRDSGLDQAESAWNNQAGWSGQNAWNRDPNSWNHPNAWNHPGAGAWNANTWNRAGYNNRYDTANRWGGADPWNRWGGAGAAGWNNYGANRAGVAGAAAGWQGAGANRWNAW